MQFLPDRLLTIFGNSAHDISVKRTKRQTVPDECQAVIAVVAPLFSETRKWGRAQGILAPVAQKTILT